MAKKKREPEPKPGLFKQFSNYLDRIAKEADQKQAEEDRFVSEAMARADQQISRERAQIVMRITEIESRLERHRAAGLTDCLLRRCDTCLTLIADRDALYDELGKRVKRG